MEVYVLEMRLVMEDNPNVAVSVAISKYINVEFASSNTNLFNIAETTSEPVVMYVDYPYGNKSTDVVYRRLLRIARRNRNVYVIPIVCVEYFVLPKDYNPKWSWVKIVRDIVLKGSIIKKPIPPRKIGYKESFSGQEKQAKLALNNCEDLVNTESNTTGYSSMSMLMYIRQVPSTHTV